MDDRLPNPSAGDHLRVRRRVGYWHHGIFVSDERVIQFGGRICDKPRANIEAVSLDEFASGGSIEAVIHPRASRFGHWLPKADSPERIIERAEWLLEHHPENRYNVVGWNCEHAANWCVNEFTESLQARRLFGINAIVGAGLLFYLAWKNRSHQPLSITATVIIVSSMAIGLSTVGLYHWNIRKFWQDVGAEWRRYGHSQGQE